MTSGRLAVARLVGKGKAKTDLKTGNIWLSVRSGFSIVAADEAIRKLGYEPEED